MRKVYIMFIGSMIVVIILASIFQRLRSGSWEGNIGRGRRRRGRDSGVYGDGFDEFGHRGDDDDDDGFFATFFGLGGDGDGGGDD